MSKIVGREDAWGNASFAENWDSISTTVDKEVLDKGLKKSPSLVGSIDQGTSSTRFLLFTPTGEIAASAQMEHKQIFPDGEDKVRLSVHTYLMWSGLLPEPSLYTLPLFSAFLYSKQSLIYCSI